MLLYARWKFTVLLTALLVVVTARMALPANSINEIVLDCFGVLLIVAAVLSIFAERRFRLAALLLGVPVIGLMIAGHAFPGEFSVNTRVVSRLLGGAFLGFTVVMTVRAVLTARDVTWDTIMGAFAGYVLIGVVWTQFFCAIDLASPGAFSLATSSSDRPISDMDRQAVLEYFSFATLSTVGYGDVAPVSQPARGLACFEAICGQFYLAVLIAGLVGIRAAAPNRRGDSLQSDPGPKSPSANST